MTTADLHARFLPRFVSGASARLAAARARVASGEPSAVESLARDLHAIAGEAGLLQLSAIAELAKEAERAARAAEPARCEALTVRLASAIAALASDVSA